MSTEAPIKSATTDLVLHCDLRNPKSFVGQPTTNYFFTPTPDVNGNVGFSANGTGTFVRIYSGNYGGYEIKPTDVVYKYTLGATGCHYHGNGYNIPAGNRLTFAFDYYVNATGYPSTNYLANTEDGGNGISMCCGDPTPSIIGVWKRAVMTSAGTSTGTGTTGMYLYPGGCGDRLATGGYILFKNPQVEAKAYPTPFVQSAPSGTGTRSSSQGLLDMSKNYLTYLSSAGFDGSGNITFNGAGNVIGIGTGNQFPHPYITVEAWVKTSGLGSGMALGGIVGFDYGRVFYITTNGNLQWKLHDGTNFITNLTTTGVNIFSNTWRHVVATRTQTYTGGISKIYVDGEEKTSGTDSNTTWGGLNLWSAMGAAIGNNPNDAYYYYNGLIAVFKIYNRGISAQEVLQNYNSARLGA